ncbi:MAG: 3'-5' exonuclease [Candidatus Geothermincolia bacterium]
MARDRTVEGKTGRADISIAEADFCAVDLETTGLSSFSRIVEVGAVRFKVGEVGQHMQTLVDPGCSIPKGAMRVHGITDEMVAGAPQAPEVLEKLLDFASGCVFVAHNAPYDTSILSTELHRAGMQFPENEVVCTIKASKRFLPRMPNYRLQTIAGVLAIDPGDFHRALSDAVAAKQIFERAVTAEPCWRDRSLASVLDQCSSARLGTKIDTDARVPGEVEEIKLAVEDAIDRGTTMVMMYHGGNRPPWPMQIKPICIFSVQGGHFLEAACNDGYTRSFRLDKIASIVSVE